MSDFQAQGDTENTPAAAGTPPPPSQANRRPAVNPEGQPKGSKTNSYRKLRKAPVWIEAACAVALVFITGFYTHYAHRQATTAQDTLNEIKSAKTDTQKLIDAAGKQADAAKKSAEAAVAFALSGEGINTQTKLAVDKFDRMAKASENSIKTAQSASQRALDASIAASRLDQRAWISLLMQSVSFKTKIINEGHGIQIDRIGLPLINTGKSPALNITAHYIVRLRTWKEPIPDYDEEMRKTGRTSESSPGLNYVPGGGNTEKYPSWDQTFIQGQVLGPGSVETFNIATGTIGNRLATKDDGSTLYVYIIGTINYDDAVATGKRHRTRFCLFNAGTGDEKMEFAPFGFCSQQNWMD